MSILLSHGCIMRELMHALLRLHVGALRVLRGAMGLPTVFNFAPNALALSTRVLWVS